MYKRKLKLTAFVIALSLASTSRVFAVENAENTATTPTAEAEQAEAVMKPTVIFVLSKDHKGLIQADLESAGATFADVAYNTVLLNIRSGDKAQLIARANAELAASRTVVLDSDGSEAEIALVSAVSLAVCRSTGGKTGAVSILKVQEGAWEVTPIETDAAYQRRQTAAGKLLSAGNTARYALGVDN